MSKNIIRSVCWDITSRCNDCCRFCYRNPDNKELDLNSNKIILRKLIDFGVDKISFVGGEPFLYTKLFELLKWGKLYAKGKTIFSITTNAILLTNFIDNEIELNIDVIEKTLELFDWITFSLDAPNKDVQSMMGRNSLHFDRIIKLLEYLNDINYQNKVKINTVASIINIDYMLDLYKLLRKYNVKRWKVFRFLPSRGSALDYRDKYYISGNSFLEKMRQIDEYNIDNKIKISINGYDNFNNSYITISSEGKLIVYEKGQYLNRVNLLNEDVNNILKYIDVDSHMKNRSDFLYI